MRWGFDFMRMCGKKKGGGRSLTALTPTGIMEHRVTGRRDEGEAINSKKKRKSAY